jgi:uncharacterized membrane protein (UPF0136 family)
MAELTDIQTERIFGEVKAAIKNERLQTELIDHCSCLIEDMLSQGVPFEQALKRSVSILGGLQLSDIEVELESVLHLKPSRPMKTTLFFSGFVAAFCILSGIAFRILHWPGADYLLLTGDLSLILCMLVLITSVIRYPNAFSRSSAIRTMSGAIAGLLLGNAGAFKIMHWPTANIQMLLGMSLLVLVFLPLFFWNLYKREIAAG